MFLKRKTFLPFFAFSVVKQHFSQLETPNLTEAIRPQQTNFKKPVNYAGLDEESQKVLIQEKINSHHYKDAIKLIDTFKFHRSTFPDLARGIIHQKIQYFSKAEPWMKVEEILSSRKDLLLLYSRKLFKLEQVGPALSIIQRHKLLENNNQHNEYIKENDEIMSEISLYLQENPSKLFEYSDNPLITHDQYAPTEELLGQESVGTYWSFKDLNLQYHKNVRWVSSRKTFEKAVESILKSDIVGIDAEYKGDNNLNTTGTSIVQIATKDCVYLFDTLKLSSSNAYHNFIRELFLSSKILKIGHSFSGDLKVMNMERKKGHPYLMINNYIDVSQMFRKIEPSKLTRGLSYICEKVLGKKMSKFEQTSNWNNRPLRKAQVHYAALDAFLLIELYNKLKETIQEKDITRLIINNKAEKFLNFNGKEGEKLIAKLESISENVITGESNRNESALFYSFQCYEHFYTNPNKILFLADHMCWKLGKYLRNIGQDTVFISEKDHFQLTETARTMQRVILTRDRNYFEQKIGVPCFLLKEMDSATQLKQIISHFKIQIENDKLLSRCVKCNHDEFTPMTHNEASEVVEFKGFDNYYHTRIFRRCKKCHTVYWDGNTFQKAQMKFLKLVQENT